MSRLSRKEFVAGSSALAGVAIDVLAEGLSSQPEGTVFSI